MSVWKAGLRAIATHTLWSNAPLRFHGTDICDKYKSSDHIWVADSVWYMAKSWICMIFNWQECITTKWFNHNCQECITTKWFTKWIISNVLKHCYKKSHQKLSKTFKNNQKRSKTSVLLLSCRVSVMIRMYHYKMVHPKAKHNHAV